MNYEDEWLVSARLERDRLKRRVAELLKLDKRRPPRHAGNNIPGSKAAAENCAKMRECWKRPQATPKKNDVPKIKVLKPYIRKKKKWELRLVA